MSRVPAIVPAESDILCEHCGYTLQGLPAASNCPECGKPIEESIQSDRVPPAWERSERSSFLTLLQTSTDVILRPTHFFRTITARGDVRKAKLFAEFHWHIATLLLASAGTIHATIFFQPRFPYIIWLWLCLATYATLATTTWAAARLTAWEANYRGIRLPLPVVRRGMYYHAAHYMPVAQITLLIVAGYAVALRYGFVGAHTITTYLYTLCAAVIVAAAYLFHTYWIGMRNMMYANR